MSSYSGSSSESGSDDENAETLLLTGFGPFANFEETNPSWESVKTLDGQWFQGESSDGAGPALFKAVAAEIPVVYDYDYNPQVLSDGETPSLIINCGVSGMLEPGFFKLEQRARNATYEKKDVDNGTPPGGICIAGGAAEFQSVLDLAKVIEEVKGGGASAPKVSVSTDAGLYLCEFTFYRSMHAKIPAVFVHVPPTSDAYNAESHADDLRQIIASIVRSYSAGAAGATAAAAAAVVVASGAASVEGAVDGGGGGGGGGGSAGAADNTINADDNEWVAYFKKTRAETGDVATAVCAMRTLIEYIRVTEAVTLSELRDGIKDVIASLTSSMPSNITSVSSGCELFLRFITLKAEYSKDFEQVKDQLVQTGQVYLRKAEAGRAKIAKKGPSFIRDGAVVLTHSYSRVALGVLIAAADANRRFEVYVTESSPGASGLKMAAKLRTAGIPVTVLPDSAVGYIMEKVDLVILGAEAIVESGGIINTIGTYQIALIAKATNTPFYVVGESFKFVRLYPINQTEIPPTSTPLQSVPKEFNCINPLMDYTPPSYITLIFTELGLLTPSAVSDELIKLYL